MAAERLRPFLQYTRHRPPARTAASMAAPHGSKKRCRSSAGSSNTGTRIPRTPLSPGKGCCRVTFTQKVTPSRSSSSSSHAALAVPRSSEAVTGQSCSIGGHGAPAPAPTGPGPGARGSRCRGSSAGPAAPPAATPARLYLSSPGGS